MHSYQAVRISINEVATYGDKYQKINSEEPLQYNEVVTVGCVKYLILFEE